MRAFGHAFLQRPGHGDRGGADLCWLRRRGLRVAVERPAGARLGRLERHLADARGSSLRHGESGVSSRRRVGLVAGKHVQRLLAHDDLSRTGGKHGHQADRFLVAADGVPGNPDAVRGPQLRLAEMVAELFGRKAVLARGRLGGLPFVGIVIGVDHQLALDRHGFVVAVVEVEAAAEAACRRPAGLGDDVGRPDGGQPHRLLGRGFDQFGAPRPGQHLVPIAGDGLAACQ